MYIYVTLSCSLIKIIYWCHSEPYFEYKEKCFQIQNDNIQIIILKSLS